ncbi:hypothetical protein [uncultured Pseudokineococcus sp.]|uniref:hypothetical protein n=1 Tax=uncultured Pseudokineococcus sp. TaxID=1642928 RepID=UPI00341C60AF
MSFQFQQYGIGELLTKIRSEAINCRTSSGRTSGTTNASSSCSSRYSGVTRWASS